MQKVSLILAVLALAASVVALVVAMQTPRLSGQGLAAYDLTTPQNAVRAGMEMQAHGDLLARLEMEEAMGACQKKEAAAAAKSLSFGKTYEVDGRTVVLYKFMRDGVERYESQWLEKSPDGCYHAVLDMPVWCWEDGSDAKGAIAKAIREWEAKNAGPAGASAAPKEPPTSE